MHVDEKEISAYLDNSLSVEKQRKLKQHFSECEECSQKLNEWDSLFATIGMLEFNFSLEGLEEKILHRIRKENEKTVENRPRVLLFNMAYVMIFLFITSLFISPVTNFAGQSIQYVGNFLFNKGIDLINDIKWNAVDIFSFIQGINLSGWLFLLLAGITLIAGGSYFSFSHKVRKA